MIEDISVCYIFPKGQSSTITNQKGKDLDMLKKGKRFEGNTDNNNNDKTLTKCSRSKRGPTVDETPITGNSSSTHAISDHH